MHVMLAYRSPDGVLVVVAYDWWAAPRYVDSLSADLAARPSPFGTGRAERDSAMQLSVTRETV